MVRFVLTLFPCFMLLGVWEKHAWVNRAIAYDLRFSSEPMFERANFFVGVSRMNQSHFRLSFDTILLLVLVMPHLWFNSASSAMMVLLLAVYVALGFLFPKMADELPSPRAIDRGVFTIRLTIILFAVMMAVLLPTGMNIFLRHVEGPATHAHDGLLQTEAAIQFLLDGKNPYTENYLDTPMGQLWKNPERTFFTTSQLYHNAYLPLLFIGSIPFYWLSHAVVGWYDQRFLYLLLYFLVLIILPQLVQEQRRKLTLLMVFGLNYLFVNFMADGRNDIVIFFGLLLTTLLLAKHHVTASAFALGLTLAVKHLAWFFLPFYYLYLLPQDFSFSSIRRVLKQTLPLFLIPAAILVPFLIWDWQSFVDDTFTFLIGSGSNSFPIQGWGFGVILFWLGWIPNAESAFPFWLFELSLGLPTLFLLLRAQRRENTLPQLWFAFAAFSFVVEFFSRFFNDNYFVFLLQALMVGAFIDPYRGEQTTLVQMRPSEPVFKGDAT